MPTDSRKINSSALLQEKLLKYRGSMASSFFDPTLTGLKKAKPESYIQMDILHAINRNSEHQFQSMAEINEYLEKRLQEKPLTD